MNYLAYKVFNLHFSSNMRLLTHICHNSLPLKCDYIHSCEHAPPQAEAFSSHLHLHLHRRCQSGTTRHVWPLLSGRLLTQWVGETLIRTINFDTIVGYCSIMRGVWIIHIQLRATTQENRTISHLNTKS